ncbi:MAG: hypothetical protein ACTSPV_14610, partial [Candidatus Hodarchaeales archaeon]
REYKLECIINLGRKGHGGMLGSPFRYLFLLKDLTTGTKILTGGRFIGDTSVFERLLSNYGVKADDIMDTVLRYLIAALNLRPDYLAYFYEKYKDMRHRELTDDELPNWYMRCEDDAAVLKSKEDFDIGLYTNKVPHDFESRMGEIFLNRLLYDFGGDIIEIREYIVGASVNMLKSSLSRFNPTGFKYFIKSYIIYINGWQVRNLGKFSLTPLKL